MKILYGQKKWRKQLLPPNFQFSVGISPAGQDAANTAQRYGILPPTKIVPELRPRPWRTRKTTSSPLLNCEVTLRKSSSEFTACLYICRNTSHLVRPMSSAY